MRTTVLALSLAALAALTASAQETPRKKVPSDSVEIRARGCFKGRAFTGSDRTAEDEGIALGPSVAGRTFRVAGPKAVMAEVKANDGHWVIVEGIVRKADLEQAMLGTRIGGARVVIGQPGRNDPSRVNMAAPAGVPVMDVTSVQYLDSSCPIR